MSVPLMATGGVSTADDVRAVMSSGAVLVGMATSLIQDPYRIPRINKALV